MAATTWVIFDIILFLLMLTPFFLSISLYRNTTLFRPLKHYCLYFIICILIYCLFDKASGDYYHYEEIIKEMSSQRTIVTHLEYIYVLIARFVHFDYFLFRLIIWGGALLLLAVCIRLNNVRKDLVYALFILCSLQIFSYARVSLGICLYLLGYLLVTQKTLHKINIVHIIVGVLLIFASAFFTKVYLYLYCYSPLVL